MLSSKLLCPEVWTEVVCADPWESRSCLTLPRHNICISIGVYLAFDTILYIEIWSIKPFLFLFFTPFILFYYYKTIQHSQRVFIITPRAGFSKWHWFWLALLVVLHQRTTHFFWIHLDSWMLEESTAWNQACIVSSWALWYEAAPKIGTMLI